RRDSNPYCLRSERSASFQGWATSAYRTRELNPARSVCRTAAFTSSLVLRGRGGRNRTSAMSCSRNRRLTTGLHAEKVAGAGVDPAAPRVWASVGSRPSLQGEVLGRAPGRWNDGDSNSDLYRARVVFSRLNNRPVRQSGRQELHLHP